MCPALMVALGLAIVNASTGANKLQKEIHIHETQSEINPPTSEFQHTEHGALWASVT